MTNQIKEYLNKYRIISKEMLEKHIEELNRNTTVDKDLVFMLVMSLDDEELFPNYFSREKKTKKVLYSTVESYDKQALQDIYGQLANIAKNEKGNYQVNIVHTKENMNRLVEEELERQEQEVFKDWNSNDSRGILTSIGCDITKPYPFFANEDLAQETAKQIAQDVKEGKKETEGKLDYELDWEFIQQMAERMGQNKGKYEPYNWKKLMDVEKLKQSLVRHTIEIMKGNYSDDGREFGHLESLADNAMMINYQLKNNKK